MSVVEGLSAEEQREFDDAILDGMAPSPDAVAATIEHVMDAVAALALLDPTLMAAETVKTWTVGLERARRRVDAAVTAAAEHVDTAEPFKADGWFTAKRWLKHTLQLSGPEAFARVQAARFGVRVPAWAQAESDGRVGVAQCKVMASIAANPRIDDDTLAAGALALLDDAINMGFDEFERLARRWEMMADPQGALDAAERSRQRRDAFIRPRPDGGWDLHALLDDIGGAEFQQVLAWYIDAEFRSDWAEALQRLGEGNVSMSDLRRTEPQRRADAMVAIARAAAAAPPEAKRPVPTVNIVIDAATIAAWADPPDQPDQPHQPHQPESGGASGGVRIPLIDPATYRDVICRTEHGHRVHPSHVVETTLWGLIRRVVIDSKGVIIDLGRKSRLFTGHARESVMLLERGFTVTRDADGNWHVHAPDGHEIT